jgi:hypothetical protein
VPKGPISTLKSLSPFTLAFERRAFYRKVTVHQPKAKIYWLAP